MLRMLIGCFKSTNNVHVGRTNWRGDYEVLWCRYFAGGNRSGSCKMKEALSPQNTAEIPPSCNDGLLGSSNNWIWLLTSEQTSFQPGDVWGALLGVIRSFPGRIMSWSREGASFVAFSLFITTRQRTQHNITPPMSRQANTFLLLVSGCF